MAVKSTARPVSWVSLVTLLTISLGVLIRLVQYLANRSLWLDEAFFSLALQSTAYSGLLHQPLLFMQTAPPFFLWLEKSLTIIFGNSEWVLRALPLAAGVASVPMYFQLTRRWLEPGAACIAVTLFALSSNLIYYASEAKPYGCDVAAAIFLALLLLDIPVKPLTNRRLIACSLAGALALWCSYPSGIVLIAAIIWLALICRSGKGGLRSSQLAPMGLLWAASFLALYQVCLRSVAQDQGLRAFYLHFWGDRFPRAASSLGGQAAEWVRVIVESFRDPGALHVPSVAAVAFVVGVLSMYRRNATNLLLVVLPILTTLVLTACQVLPFGNRLILFLVPFLLVPVAEGIWSLTISSVQWLRLGGGVFGAIILAPLLLAAFQLLFHPIQIEELKPVLAYVERHRAPTDAVYIYHWSQYPFRYYAPRYGFDPNTCILGEPLNEPAGWLQVEGLRRHQRTWVVISQGYRWVALDDERRLLERLDQAGQRVEAIRRTGAAAYLYQFPSGP